MKISTCACAMYDYSNVAKAFPYLKYPNTGWWLKNMNTLILKPTIKLLDQRKGLKFADS